MGSINEAGFSAAIQNGANSGDGEIEAFEGDDSSIVTSSGNNPESLPSSFFGDPQNGNFPRATRTLMTFEANQDGNISRVDVRITDPSSPGLTRIMRLDENDTGTDFPASFQSGSDVTVNPGYINAGSQGLAEALGTGLGSYRYKLQNGSGTTLKTLTPTDGAHVPIGYSGGGVPVVFEIGSNLTFDNTSGSEWSDVQSIRIEDNSTGSLLFEDSSFSASVPDQGSITFTTLRLEVSF
jgi:hypothetical protein